MDKINDPFRGRMHYRVVFDFLKKLKGNFKILEIGAQDEVIRKFIPNNMTYSSLDALGNPDYKVDLNTKKVPVKDGAFDILICLETLEHTLYPKKILEEIKRVTKKDGLFILSMPNDYNFWLRLNYLFGIKSECTDEPFEVVSKYQHIHKPRVKDILNLFSENFKIIKVIPFWQSRGGTTNNFYYFLDRIINFLASLYPSLFARLVIVIAKPKNEINKSK